MLVNLSQARPLARVPRNGNPWRFPTLAPDVVGGNSSSGDLIVISTLAKLDIWMTMLVCSGLSLTRRDVKFSRISRRSS